MVFQNANISVVRKRIPQEHRDRKKWYYEVRYEESDKSRPFAVESVVRENFWGMVVADRAIAISEGCYLRLPETQRQRFVEETRGI